jgi:hypothetical protein
MIPPPQAAISEAAGQSVFAALRRLLAGDFYPAVPRLLSEQLSNPKSAGAMVPLSLNLHEGFPPAVSTLPSLRI